MIRSVMIDGRIDLRLPHTWNVSHEMHNSPTKTKGWRYLSIDKKQLFLYNRIMYCVNIICTY